MTVDVIVVGAGLSGLVTAFRLHQSGYSVHVVEAAARPGGVISSGRRSGVLYERGPNTAMDTSGAIGPLLTELGLDADRVDAQAVASRRYIVHRGALEALPTSALSFVRTPLFSTHAKLRLFGEPFIGRAPKSTEESIAQFVERRLGREILDYAVEPFVSGIFAGDPDQLSLAAALPALHGLEQRYGSLTVGAVRAARERRRQGEPRRARPVSFSFRDGMQTLTDALAARLPVVECNAVARGLARELDGTWTVHLEGAAPSRRAARAVVLALPAYGAAPLIRPLAPQAAGALGEISYAPIAIVVSAYRRREVGHPLDGFGFLAPAVEQPRLLGTLFSSSMFEHRAAAEVAVFTSFLGGQRRPEQAAAPYHELLATTHDELARLLDIGGNPLFTHVTRWTRAIPQYERGHGERITRIGQAESDYPGLVFCANYRGGISISDCVGRANEATQHVARHLGAPPAR